MERVSVVIPTYNRAALLRHAIQSVIDATVPDDEIIVVDDGSTDETPQIPKEFRREIRYIAVPNGGAGAARNAGVKAASNDLIGFLDSDDVWLPDRLAQQRPLMEARRDLVFSFSDFGQLFPDGHIEHSWIRKWAPDRRPWSEIVGPAQPCSTFTKLAEGVADVPVHIGNMYRNELQTNYVNVITLLVRRSLAGDALHFAVGVPTWEEWECIAQISRLGPCAFLDVETAMQRTHYGQRLTDANTFDVALARLAIIARTWAADDEFSRLYGEELNAVAQPLRKTLVRGYIRRGEFALARKEAAMLTDGHVESFLLRLPSPVLSTLFRIREKVKGIARR